MEVKTKRKNFPMAWINNKKDRWNDPVKLDNKASENIADIR